MDIKCHQCREPWDIDSLHDLVAEGHFVDFEDARKGFYRDGCGAFGEQHNGPADPADTIGVLQELLGDDVDGLAAMIQDFGL